MLGWHVCRVAVATSAHGPGPMVQPRAASGLAVFDLDRTLIPGSSLAVFGRAAVDDGLVRRRDVARFTALELAFRRRGLGDRAVARLCASLLGLAVSHRHDRLLDVASRLGPRLADTVFPGARLLIEQHRRTGDLLVVVSASPQELVAVVARALEIDVAIGTCVEVHDGLLTGRLASTFCYGEGKVERVRESGIDLGAQTVTAYADSRSDLALLRVVDRPVVVNADRRLAAEAADRGWPTLRW